jgi:gamma-glutamyltranspeptidase/glutathione hydrolase
MRLDPPQIFGAVLRRVLTAAIVAAPLLAACAPIAAPAITRAFQAGGEPHFMAAAANPLAADVGRDVLAKGGNAVDAAIAMQMVLNLVEPQSSGIGGGGFLLYYDAGSGDVTAYDGRETAPMATSADMFLAPDGTPREFDSVAVGGLAAGVPGLAAMLELAHRDHGHIAWRDLFAPAIKLAEDGFPVSPRLYMLIAGDEKLKTFPEAARYFFHSDGSPRDVGEVLKNPELAETLRAIAAKGAGVFYQGPIAHDIVRAAAASPINPGRLAESDLAAYRAQRRAPVCGDYREYRICGVPPPSSGGVTLLEALGILQSFDLESLGPEQPQSVHLIAEASRLAFADRNYYLGDPDFVAAPVGLMLERGYLARRAALISPNHALDRVRPGVMSGGSFGAVPVRAPVTSTTHFSVVDREGNAVALTSSIQTEFGSRLMVRGFLLNNELTDFAFRPETEGRTAANAPAPGKRPLSTMAPTFVFDPNNRLRLAVGSPGGQNIIDYVLKVIVGTIDWNLDIQQAIDLPNFVDRTGTLELEAGTPLESLNGGLAAMGHKVETRQLNSGLQGIAITAKGLAGGADLRREGAVRKD